MMRQILLRTDGRTDGRTNGRTDKAILGVGWSPSLHTCWRILKENLARHFRDELCSVLIKELFSIPMKLRKIMFWIIYLEPLIVSVTLGNAITINEMERLTFPQGERPPPCRHVWSSSIMQINQLKIVPILFKFWWDKCWGENATWGNGVISVCSATPLGKQ